MTLTPAQFVELRDMIYHKTGLYFAEKKLFFIQRHVLQRIKERSFSSVSEYLKYLRFSDFQGLEFQQLANAITTNETYFFREFDQLACFAEDCLPEILRLHQDRQFRVLCAACSTGEEAYTLSIILSEFLPMGWKYEIQAFDIDQNALAKARAGLYGDRSVQEVPEEYYRRYFNSTPEGHLVKPTVRAPVRFTHVNMMDNAVMGQLQHFDAIFCRNVLIYFDDLSRSTVVHHLYNALRPGGFIYLGHSESVGRITAKFVLRRFSKALVYQKPL